MTIEILQQYVKYCQKQIMVLQGKNEELEQYGRKLCFRLQAVSSTNRETSEAVLEKFQSKIKESTIQCSRLRVSKEGHCCR